MMLKKIKQLFIFTIITTGFLFAQRNSGNLSGLVSDANNQPLIGANIILPNLERGASTDKNGYFEINQLPVGEYLLVVKYIGYLPTKQIVNVQADGREKVQISMTKSILDSEPIVITGSPVAVNPMASPQSIDYISGREKIQNQSTSLGKTLEAIPGIYNISAGSVAGKPVIRGQSGERIRVMNDGIPQEYQQYGERHAPTLDPFNADRVEVIKGAASLLYGSDAIGGAVNLIPNRFHVGSKNEVELNGALATGFQSNNDEVLTGMKMSGARGRLGFSGSLVHRNAQNYRSPEIDSFGETNQIGDPKFTGEINHTDFEQFNGSAGIGLLNSLGLFSIHYDHYANENNFLLPTGKPIGIKLNNHNIITKANIPGENIIIKPKFTYQHNQRQATKPGYSRTYLPDSANVDLVLDVFTGRLEVDHINTGDFSGTFGAEVKYYDHDNIGLVPLQPDGHYTNIALFGLETYNFKKMTLNFGARYDFRQQKFYKSDHNPLLPTDDSRHFSSFSGAFGIAYKLTDWLTVTGNMGRGFRTPSFYNLYVYGYHGGVFAFQIGKPSLKNETSLDLNSSLRFKTDYYQASVNFFRNQIDNYIYHYNAAGHELAPADEIFVFAHDQADAVMTGLDLSLRVNFGKDFLFTGDYSMLNSQFLNGIHSDNELPMMPSDRIRGELRYLLPNVGYFYSNYIALGIQHVAAKKAAGIYEPFGQFDDGIGPNIPFGVASTSDYSLVDLQVGFDLLINKTQFNVDLEISNLLNTDYRDFLDTYKGYALAPGRSVNLKIYLPFHNNF